MAKTIPGGAFLKADGKTWVNANGEPLSDEAIEAAKQLAAENAAENAAAEEELQSAARKAMLLKHDIVEVTTAPAEPTPPAKK